MRVNHNKTWACHENIKKPCLGALNYLKSKKLPFKVIDSKLVNDFTDWTIYLKEPLSEKILNKLRKYEKYEGIKGNL